MLLLRPTLSARCRALPFGGLGGAVPLPGPVSLPALPAPSGADRRLARVGDAWRGAHQIVECFLDERERLLGRLDWQIAESQTWPLGRISRRDPSSVDMGQAHINPEARSDEAET